MINIEQFEMEFSQIKGKTIAIVYIFEGDTSNGMEHFFIWKSNVIGRWMNAVQGLHCLPLILDVRTFVDKAINNTLPHIDYVLNLNSGTYDLSSMALIPATCSSINVPCIPCDAIGIVTGENKHLSNLIAKSTGINIPKYLDVSDENGIFRPINWGNSQGVVKGYSPHNTKGIYQEFIPGYDITTPVVYNPLTKTMELMPTVLYISDINDLNWFFGEEAKSKQQGYQFKLIDMDDKLRKKYLEMVGSMSVQTFCRIDARIKCTDIKHSSNIFTIPAQIEDTYFIEINTMPTIRPKNSFNFSFSSISNTSPLYQYLEYMKQMVQDIDLNSFLLVSSMMSFIKSTY